MDKIKAVITLFSVLILAIAILVLWLLPIMEVTYMEEETYTDIETYLEKEPYTGIETDTELEPQTVTETYYEPEPYTVTQDYLYVVTDTGIIDEPKTDPPGGYAWIKIKNQEIGEAPGLFAVHFDVELEGGAKWKNSDSDRIEGGETTRLSVFYSGELIADFDYEIYIIPEKDVILYRDVKQTREVTKYVEVEKEREVNLLKDVEKQREVLAVREVEKTKNVPLFEYWFKY